MVGAAPYLLYIPMITEKYKPSDHPKITDVWDWMIPMRKQSALGTRWMLYGVQEFSPIPNVGKPGVS